MKVSYKNFSILGIKSWSVDYVNNFPPILEYFLLRLQTHNLDFIFNQQLPILNPTDLYVMLTSSVIAYEMIEAQSTGSVEFFRFDGFFLVNLSRIHAILMWGYAQIVCFATFSCNFVTLKTPTNGSIWRPYIRRFLCYSLCVKILR